MRPAVTRGLRVVPTMKTAKIPCLTGRREFAQQKWGDLSPEHVARMIDPAPDSTCLLWEGHKGPHEWTPNDRWGLVRT